MAKCDQGYICDICGEDVASIIDSELYLRYVLGEVPLERLHLHPERHIRCNPAIAQYIVDGDFQPVVCTGDFSKQSLDPAYVAQEEARVSAGWRRLAAIPTLGLAVAEYPLHITPEHSP